MDLGEIFDFFEDFKKKIIEVRVFRTSLAESYGLLLKFEKSTFFYQKTKS